MAALRLSSRSADRLCDLHPTTSTATLGHVSVAYGACPPLSSSHEHRPTGKTHVIWDMAYSDGTFLLLPYPETFTRVQQQVCQSSRCTKGLAISSAPSAGEINTRSVPRATTRPSERVVSLPVSSRGEVSPPVLERTIHSPKREQGDQTNLPLITSLTSSRTRFMSGSYPLRVPVTVGRQRGWATIQAEEEYMI